MFLGKAIRNIGLLIVVLALYLIPVTSYGQARVLDIEILTKEAEQGSLSAIRKLGNFYNENNNIKKAEKWYRFAIYKGDGRSALSIVLMHNEKKLILKNPDKMKNIGLSYLNENATNGNIGAIMFLASAYEKGQLLETNYKKAHEWLEEADSLGDMRAAYLLGIGYTNGLYKNVDTALAFRYFKKAANSNIPKATRQVAIAYMSGIGTKKNIEKAGVYYKKAALQGDVLSMIDYANFLKMHKKSNKDYIYWLSMAEKQDNSDAAYYLGYFYKKKNAEKSNYYFKKAANEKHYLAYMELNK